MIVHVRNFGKIESADIDLSNLTIFVGENNSGKSYLMQLIYGLLDYFNMSKDFFSKFMLNYNGITMDNDIIEIKSDNTNFYSTLQSKLNIFINSKKNEIVKRIFKTDHLNIESISVEFGEIKHDICLKPDHVSLSEYEKGVKRYMILKDNKTIISKISTDNFVNENLIQDNTFIKLILLSTLLSEIIFGESRQTNNTIIYLPASRSGLMLLHADYMANGINNRNIFNDRQNIENEFGLTQPVYDFLSFLLKYKTSEMISDENKSIISFIDNNIINGSMEKTGNTMRYKPASSENSLPIYLSSSLVSELTPIYQILSGIQRYKFILYDEIETCQHPTKQLQLARLLVRMVNAGYRMIVSTHSDTMASAINNLVSLSFKENKNELISKLGYEPEDILNSNNVNAYQFVIGENGKTKVLEVPQHFSIGVGFDFNLFNNANNKIYEDAVKLSEVD